MTPHQTTLRRQVMALAGPAVFHGLVSTIVLFTDRLILGAFHGDALASMQASGPLLWSAFSLFGAYGAGLLAVAGRAFGAKDRPQVRQTIGTGLVISILGGSVIGLIGVLFCEPLVDLIASPETTSSDIRHMASDYMFIVLLAAPIQTLAGAAMVSLQALGDTRTLFRAAMAAGVINLGVSWALVFGIGGLPALGIKGAAIGTVASFTINAVILFYHLWAQKTGYGIGSPTTGAANRILRIAGPAFVERALFHGGYIAFTMMIGRLGDTAMTAHQALMAIESLGFIGASAFGVAASAMVAQKLGSGEPGDAQAAAHLSARMGLLVLSAVGAIFFLFADSLVALFSSDPAVVEMGASCLMIAAIAQPLMAITDVYAGSLRGAGDTRTPLYVAIGGPVIVRLLFCWLFAYELGFGLIGIWIGSTLDWAVRSVWLFLAFQRGNWRAIDV